MNVENRTIFEGDNLHILQGLDSQRDSFIKSCALKPANLLYPIYQISQYTAIGSMITSFSCLPVNSNSTAESCCATDIIAAFMC